MVRKIDFSSMTEEIKKKSGKEEFVDPIKEKLYQPKLKEDGTFQAIIRFLPRHENDTSIIPYVKVMSHVFQTKNNQWIYEVCPTTLGKTEKCPICERNGEEWKDESKREAVRKKSRKTHYYSNIVVIKDPQNPQNDGKVFILRYGKSIFDKIVEKISPEDGSLDQKVNVFDYTEGQNFKLKIKKVGTGSNSWPNYDQSGFNGISTPLYADEAKIDAVDKQLHLLGELDSKDKVKSYSELKEIYEKKMGYTDSNEEDYKPAKKVVGKTVEDSLDDEDEVKPTKIPKVEISDFDDEDEFLKELDEE